LENKTCKENDKKKRVIKNIRTKYEKKRNEIKCWELKLKEKTKKNIYIKSNNQGNDYNI